MKKYYYVKAQLKTNQWEELIVSQDDPEESITPHILIWGESKEDKPLEYPMFQIHYRKYFGMWEIVHYSFAYLPDDIVIHTVDLERENVDNRYPPGFVMKQIF